jgi:hypothetical protein
MKVLTTDGDTRWGGTFRSDFHRQVKINDMWTYGDWGLNLASEPNIESAKAKTKLVDIPAGDGSLDLTQALTPNPVYFNRKITFGLVFDMREKEWNQLRVEIENYCNGQRVTLQMPEDEMHYFKGRCEITGFEKDGPVAVLRFSVDCDPWRYKLQPTELTVRAPFTENLIFNCYNERRNIIPVLTVTGGNARFNFGGKDADLEPGVHMRLDMIFKPGYNRVAVRALSTVPTTLKIEYQEASL